MADDFEIRGADQFYRLSKSLQAAGRTGVRRELHNAMKRAARPLTKVAKDAAREVFPKSGGLNEREAKIPFAARVFTSADNHGVDITAPGKWVAAKTTNASGTLRKPVFADKSKPKKEWVWRDQEIPGSTGWFDTAMEGSAPLVRPELEQAMDKVIEQIVKEAR